jgi:hypothetical protein
LLVTAERAELPLAFRRRGAPTGGPRFHSGSFIRLTAMIMINEGRVLLDEYENRLSELRRFL